MKFLINLIFILSSFAFFVAGALYLQNQSQEKYVEIFSDEYV